MRGACAGKCRSRLLPAALPEAILWGPGDEALRETPFSSSPVTPDLLPVPPRPRPRATPALAMVGVREVRGTLSGTPCPSVSRPSTCHCRSRLMPPAGPLSAPVPGPQRHGSRPAGVREGADEHAAVGPRRHGVAVAARPARGPEASPAACSRTGERGESRGRTGARRQQVARQVSGAVASKGHSQTARGQLQAWAVKSHLSIPVPALPPPSVWRGHATRPLGLRFPRL